MAKAPNFQPGHNPRLDSRHKERGKKRFPFTYADIAALVGFTESAVRADVTRGKLDPQELKSVILYVVKNAYDLDLRKAVGH